MILSWRYDGGESYYMAAIDRWSEERQPGWRCQWRGSFEESEIITKWLDDQFGERCDYTWRFNGGDPYMSIEIYGQEDATLFFMTWSNR
jgi:hypothetical protein